ncbi:MAG: 3',5'-cyclic adenosine monophosphate phosphodiesterase CpdA [Rhodocyclaceae bacterium]|nr:3',5'-cyclic adenosine monophosphate phosphodiesterase CpdA [Rhodocyclaceae bacterium]
MRPKIRLAHASDIHLDTDYYGGEHRLDRRDRCRRVFRLLLDEVIAQTPDALLIAGDLFDSNRASDDTILWAMEALGGLPFPVLMIPGNHDCLEGNGIYRRHDFNRIANVQMIMTAEGETVELPELKLSAWGKGMVVHSPAFSPLADMPPVREGWWNLALGHGIYVDGAHHSYRSSQIRSEQIGTSGRDYIALGHHHGLQDVSDAETAACYSGSPEPVADDAGTFVTVDLEHGVDTRVLIHRID